MRCFNSDDVVAVPNAMAVLDVAQMQQTDSFYVEPWAGCIFSIRMSMWLCYKCTKDLQFPIVGRAAMLPQNNVEKSINCLNSVKGVKIRYFLCIIAENLVKGVEIGYFC